MPDLTPEDLDLIEDHADETWQVSNNAVALDLVGDARTLVAEVRRLTAALDTERAKVAEREDEIEVLEMACDAAMMTVRGYAADLAERDGVLGAVAALTPMHSDEYPTTGAWPNKADVDRLLAPMSGAVEMVGGGCECWVTPESSWTRYGSAVEPGSQVEPNPDCPAHGDVSGAVAKHEQEVRADERERVTVALERLIELRKDYLPGLTGAQMPHIDLIASEINTVRNVLRILKTGDARGWAHSSRWDQLDGLDVLARADALTPPASTTGGGGE
jgi:hypothetical protein